MAPARYGLLALGVLSAGLLVLGPPEEAPPAPGEKEIVPGLRYRDLPVSPAESREPFTLAVLDVDPQKLALRVLDARSLERAAMTAREFCESFRAFAAINGGFFLEDLTPLGLLVCDGRERNPLRKADWGVFYVPARGAPRIVHTREFAMQDGVTQALQAGPRLVVDGKALKLKPQTARRSLVGVDRRGHVVLAASREGRALASDLAAVASQAAHRGGLGLSYALNLDGGPSTQLYARAGELELHVPGAWPVPSALAVCAREPPAGRS